MAREVMSEIAQCINLKKNFLLSGGAGSGKTHSLVETIRVIRDIDKTAQIACITFTNVAADEIKSRINLTGLYTSTIHDFLWSMISSYQKNLKEAIIALITADKESPGTGLSYTGEIELSVNSFHTVQYKKYKKIEEGIITHDDVLKIARHLFRKYPILSKVLSDKFPYVLIDEYQDTQKHVIDIFLESVNRNRLGQICIGFFGDKMQSIYDSGVVNIQNYVENGDVIEITKEDNYRCSQNVIRVLNKLRSDINQRAANADELGVLQNKQGSAKFVFSCNDFDMDLLRDSISLEGWNLQDAKQTKILFLTHKLIARKQGYFELLDAQEYSDSLTGIDKSSLSLHILRIAKILFNFKNKVYRYVIEEIETKPRTLQDKGRISNFLSEMSQITDQSIETFIQRFDAEGLIYIDDSLRKYQTNHEDEYQSVVALPFNQVENFYKFDNSYSPYSTQHGIKGTEFENVLVVLDNGKWSKYNFKNFFEEKDKASDIYRRTERLFYVCCSRSKNNLVVFFQNPSPLILDKAKNVFGDENVIKI